MGSSSAKERLTEPLTLSLSRSHPSTSYAFCRAIIGLSATISRGSVSYSCKTAWEGKALLPDNWVVYSRGPARTLPDGSYGAHLWLRLPESAGLGVPPMPEDAFYFLGYDEQIVAIVPSRDLVIVRLGLTQYKGAWDSARDLSPIVAAFPPLSG